MDWNKIISLIPDVVDRVRKEYIVNNRIIKDDIFKILEKHCIVLYYPIPEETKNRGFHIKRFLNGKLTDFVYINTANAMAEQIFAAAHELGHVWKVADKVWEELDTNEELTKEFEEKIVGRFAAELLMPEKEFKKTFWAHVDELSLDPARIRFEEIIRVMVMQMADYMVPYEAVRRRMLETKILPEKLGDVLCADREPRIEGIVSTYLKDLNTALEKTSRIKSIPGLRDLLTKAEISRTVSPYVLSKIKEDFSVESVNKTETTIDISVEER